MLNQRRESVFTPEKVKELVALSVQGYKLAQIAEHFGVDRKTAYYHLKKFEKTGRIYAPHIPWKKYEGKEAPSWYGKEYLDENRPKHENKQFLYNEYAAGKGEFINKGKNYAEYFVKNEKIFFRPTAGK